MSYVGTVSRELSSQGEANKRVNDALGLFGSQISRKADSNVLQLAEWAWIFIISIFWLIACKTCSRYGFRPQELEWYRIILIDQTLIKKVKSKAIWMSGPCSCTHLIASSRSSWFRYGHLAAARSRSSLHLTSRLDISGLSLYLSIQQAPIKSFLRYKARAGSRNYWHKKTRGDDPGTPGLRDEKPKRKVDHCLFLRWWIIKSGKTVLQMGLKEIAKFSNDSQNERTHHPISNNTSDGREDRLAMANPMQWILQKIFIQFTLELTYRKSGFLPRLKAPVQRTGILRVLKLSATTLTPTWSILKHSVVLDAQKLCTALKETALGILNLL